MRKLGVEEWLVSAVISMYTGAKTVVRTVHGNSNSFEVKLGMHQRSALSPFCYLWLSWKLYLENSELPYHGSYCNADDLVVIAKTEDDLINLPLTFNDISLLIGGERQKVMQLVHCTELLPTYLIAAIVKNECHWRSFPYCKLFKCNISYLWCIALSLCICRASCYCQRLGTGQYSLPGKWP